MKRLALFFALSALACGGAEPGGPTLSKEPISVRGWILDVDSGSAPTSFKTVETEMARKASIFAQANVYVENAPYVSGGVDEHGAFVLLDVPPGKSEIVFSAPGAPNARLLLDKVPGNADVVIPGLVLKPNGVALSE